MFLSYFCDRVPITLGIYEMRAIKFFHYVIAVTFESHLGMGLVVRRTNHMTEG